MFDETFFQTSLPEHIKAKETESVDQPSVYVMLRNGREYKISRILEVSPQWVMCEILTFPICSLSEYGYGFLDGTP